MISQTATQPHSHTATQLSRHAASRIVLSALCSCASAILLAQQPFVPRDQFNEAPSDAWRYLPNAGQAYDVGGNYREDVHFHSVGTFPSIYAMARNRVAVVVPKADLPAHEHDSLKRVDFAFTGPDAKVSTPILLEETQRRYNFYEKYAKRCDWRDRRQAHHL